MSTDLTPTITDDEVAALPLAEARADLLRELLAETGAAAEPVRRPRRRWAPLVAAAAVLAIGVPVALGQLGGDDGGGRGVATDPGTPSAPPAVPAPFQVRVVGLSSQMPMSDDPERAEVETYVCPERPVAEAPEKAQLACDADGVRYLLGNAVIEGGVVSAHALIPENQVNWVVAVQFDDAATEAWAQLTRQFIDTGTQIAWVLDGTVLSAPTINGAVTTGDAQISGAFTRADAEALAARLVAQP